MLLTSVACTGHAELGRLISLVERDKRLIRVKPHIFGPYL